MEPPTFTSNERRLIEYHKNQTGSPLAETLWDVLPYMIPACGVVVWGLLEESSMLVFTGFFLVMGFKIRDIYQGTLWSPHYHSLFKKCDDYFLALRKETSSIER